MKVSFLFYETIPDREELARRMRRLAEIGYHGIELSAFHPMPYSADDLESISRQCRMPVASFLSGWSYSHEGLCMSSPDAAIRERAVGRLGEYAALAGRLKSVLVVGLMQGLRKDEPDPAKAGPRITECLLRAAAVAARNGVTMVLEPVNHMQVGFHNTAAEAAEVVAQVGSPGLSYMLDTIHMNIEERSILETIREHGGRIRHFHLCETNGGPFGTGNLDFPRVLAGLKEAGYGGYISVKVYRNAGWEEAARSAAEHLGRLGIRFDPR